MYAEKKPHSLQPPLPPPRRRPQSMPRNHQSPAPSSYTPAPPRGAEPTKRRRRWRRRQKWIGGRGRAWHPARWRVRHGCGPCRCRRCLRRQSRRRRRLAYVCATGIRTDSCVETACQESVSEIITVPPPPSLSSSRPSPRSVGRSVGRGRSIAAVSVLGRELIGPGPAVGRSVGRSRSVEGRKAVCVCGRGRKCLKEDTRQPPQPQLVRPVKLFQSLLGRAAE